MKVFFVIFFLLIFQTGFSQSDTLNRIGADGKKYGYWKVNHKEFYSKKKFRETYLKEEGKYEAGKKTGLWKSYYPDSTLKSEIEYLNNRPNGKFITYYDNGNVEEEGFWGGDHYYNSFRRYGYDGCLLMEKKFNDKGRVESYVRYYSFTSCNIQIESVIKNDEGELHVLYDTNGNEIHRFYQTTFKSSDFCFPDYYKKIKSLCSCEVSASDSLYSYWSNYFNIQMKGVFKNNRLFSGACEVNYYIGHSIEKDILIVREGEFFRGPNPRNEANLDGKEAGEHKIFNSFGQVIMEGEFKKGELYNGKKYVYDYNGLLEKVEIYKNGKYVGDAQID